MERSAQTYHILKNKKNEHLLAFPCFFDYNYNYNYNYYYSREDNYSFYLNQALKVFFEQGYEYINDVNADNAAESINLFKKQNIEHQIKELDDILNSKIDKELALKILMLDHQFDKKSINIQYKKLSNALHPDKNKQYGYTPKKSLLFDLIAKAKDVLHKDLT